MEKKQSMKAGLVLNIFNTKNKKALIATCVHVGPLVQRHVEHVAIETLPCLEITQKKVYPNVI